MKKIAIALAAITVLLGCAANYNGGISIAEQKRIEAEVEATRNAAEAKFPLYVQACKNEFPDAWDTHNDGTQNLSGQYAVNVALISRGQKIVCSVGRDTLRVERVFTGARTLTLSEYKAELEKNPKALARPVNEAYIEPDPPENEPRLSYKNVRIGDSIARFKFKIPLYACHESACSFFQSSCESSFSSAPRASSAECALGTSYGGAAPKYGYATFSEGKLSSVSLTISTDQMAVLDATLTQKYGKPVKIDSTPFMNKMGNSIPNAEKTWIVEGEKLVLTYRSSVVDEGKVEISGRVADAQRKEDFEKRLKANTKDF